MQQEPDHIPTRGIAVLTANGYEVPEGRGEFMNRNSILLLIGQSISLIGDGFYLLTVSVWLLTYLVASATTPAAKADAALMLASVTSTILGAQYLSQFLILPFAGVFVDRWNRKTVMLVANLVQVVLALLPLAAYYGPRNLFLPTLYVTFFLLVVAQGFLQSAELGTVQVIVSKRRAPQLISFFQTLIALGTVLGALFSGAFFLSTGPVLAIGFNALSFLISAIFIFFMQVPREALHPHAYRKSAPEGQNSVSTGLGGVLKDLGTGARFSFTTALIFGLIIMLVVVQIGAGAVNGLYGGFFVLNLHGNPVKNASLLNILPAAIGAGALIGAQVVAEEQGVALIGPTRLADMEIGAPLARRCAEVQFAPFRRRVRASWGQVIAGDIVPETVAQGRDRSHQRPCVQRRDRDLHIDDIFGRQPGNSR